MHIDPVAFHNQDPELEALNGRIVAFQKDLPDFWTLPCKRRNWPSASHADRRNSRLFLSIVYRWNE